MGANSSETTLFHCFTSLLLLLLLFVSNSSAAQMKKMSSKNAYSVLQPCINGSVAECSDQEEELLMESEISRRFLAASRQISYRALKPDKPGCGAGRGESYSRNGNCLPPPSNPYNRGCFKYYKCRSDS